MDLSKEALMSLKLLNSQRITQLERYLKLAIKSKSFFYSNCDKNDINTLTYFKSLNETKDVIKYYQKELKKVRSIQKDIKKAIADWVDFEAWMTQADADIAKEG